MRRPLSTYKSIAGVSQSLVNLLGDRMVEPATITLAPPDVQVDQVGGPRLNIYLYHLSENAFLKNQEIPGNGHPGAYGHPPLALNLHYIFTAFGKTRDRRRRRHAGAARARRRDAGGARLLRSSPPT